MKYVIRATFRISGTLHIDADSDEEALRIGQEHAEDFGVPGLGSIDEELDDVEIESVEPTDDAA